MLQDMTCRVSQGAKYYLGPEGLLLPTVFWGQTVANKRKSPVMRKQLELARLGCKLLRSQSICECYGSGQSASVMRTTQASRAPRTSDLPGQQRPFHSRKGGSGGSWQDKRIREREAEEEQRGQLSPHNSKHSRRHQVTSAIRLPNDAVEARSRANPHDAAHPSHAATATAFAEAARSSAWSANGVNGHSSRRPVKLRSTAAQPSTAEIQEALESIVIEEDDLHSPQLSHLSSLVRCSFEVSLVCLLKHSLPHVYLTSIHAFGHGSTTVDLPILVGPLFNTCHLDLVHYQVQLDIH